MKRLFFALLMVCTSSATYAESPLCAEARTAAQEVPANTLLSTAEKEQALVGIYPPSRCQIPNYRLQLGILQAQIDGKGDLAKDSFKAAIKQANKSPSLLRAHTLAWYSRHLWQAAESEQAKTEWTEEVLERERAIAYKEARNAKEIYNQEYEGQELDWFDDFLLDMGERLKNPTVVAIAAQLDMQTVSRDAIAIANTGNVELRINFAQNSDRLTAAGDEAISRLLSAIESLQLASDGSVKLELVGHTSTEGESDYNLDLSRRRAEAVKRAIVSQQPSLALRLKATGLGESEPIYANDVRDLMRQANRRVEIKLSGS